VGVCTFPYTYTEFTCGCVWNSVYSHRVHVVCKYLRTYTQGFPVGVYVYLYMYEAFTFLCVYIYV